MTDKSMHELKISPSNFSDVASSRMSFQIRKDDRNYKIDDYIYLREYDEDTYTGRSLPARITHLLSEAEGLQKGYVLLNIKVKGLIIHEGERYDTSV